MVVPLLVVLVTSSVAGATVVGHANRELGDTATPSAADGVAAEAEADAPAESPARASGFARAQDGGETGDEATGLACGGSVPADLADPQSDVKGWENGYWYNESIDISQSDGVQKAERERLVSRTMARVEAVRCIEFNRSVPVSVVSRQQFANRQARQNASPGLRAFDNAKFEALFLVNESADSIAVQNRNRGSNVLGFYSPRADRIVVIAENAKSLRIDELTLAHELMHAWQDQQYNLTGDPFGAKLRDQVNARNGLIEGDASYTERLYERQCKQGTWDCLQRPSDQRAQTNLANMGIYLLKYQPYSDGPAFVRLVQNVGGWDAVNALYENPPASTEQVIHPERYEADPPTNVTLADQTGGDWSRVRAPNRPGYGSLGEAGLMAMFIYPYYHSGGQSRVIPPSQWFNRNESGEIKTFDPLDYKSQYTTGWDGDRLHVYRNGSGELGYVWKLAWDSPQDARQFVAGYRKVLRYWGAEQVGENTWRIADSGFADAFHVAVEGNVVTITNAPTVDQLSAVRSSVTVDAETDGANATATGGNATATETGETAAGASETTEAGGPADSATVNVTVGNETASPATGNETTTAAMATP
ncbi:MULTISPECIES: Hvo_1808 family surface protein [Halorussus]|uniref:Hvo_1808 family surface protein n=1 Tax=Halorussus TaxID=1070314 RepID=UPI0020A21E81|nr:Hvo_1808 family surface protein [Halorussus vallis]USZ74647.1 Hvo_1808 family surface protein [Halorussus vallis]